MDRVLNKLNSVTKDTTNQVKKISDKVNALSELTKGVLGAGAAARHTAEMEAAAAAARKVAANAAANAAAAQRLAAEDKNAATAKAAANAVKSAEAAAKAAKEAEAAANEANQNRKRAALFENTAADSAADAAAAANEANQNRKRAALFENTAENSASAAAAAAAAANEANQNRKRAALFENANKNENTNLSKVNTSLFNNDKKNNSNLAKINTSLFQNTPSVAGRLALENVKENAPQLQLTVPQQTRLRSYAEDLYRVVRANPSAQVFIARTFEEIRRNELTSEQILRILSNLRAIAREDSRTLTDRNQPLDMVLNTVTENASANRSAIGPPTPTTDQRATLRNMVSRFFNIGMDVVNGLSDTDLFNALLLYHFLSMAPRSARSSGARSSTAAASAPGLGNRAQELEDRAPQNRPPAQLALQDRNENRGLRIRTPPNAQNLYVSPASTGSLSLSNYDNNYRGNFTNDETPNPTPKASSRLNPGSSKNMVVYAKGGRRSRKMKSSRRMSCGCGVKFGGARKTRNRKNKRKSKTSRR
jgi:hypothetical protein